MSLLVWWWWFGFVGQAIFFYSFPISSPFPFSSPSIGWWSTKRVTGVARIASANFSHCVMPQSIAVSVVVVTFPSNSFSIIASNSLVLLLLIGDDGCDICPAGGIMSMKNFVYFVSKLLLTESTSGSASPSDCRTLRRLALSRVGKGGIMIYVIVILVGLNLKIYHNMRWRVGILFLYVLILTGEEESDMCWLNIHSV